MPESQPGRLPVVILACDGEVTAAIYNALAKVAEIRAVVLQDPVPRKETLRRRARIFGWASAIGQGLFALLLRGPVHRAAAHRISDIKARNGLDCSPAPAQMVRRVATVNNAECRKLLRQLQPKLVIVNGTRIIGRKTLSSVPAPFVNIHCGITPQYRGVHGGYWALADRHPELCGVTVHLVDEGVNSGEILAQAVIEPQPEDNLASYLWLQIAAGIPLLVRAVEAAVSGQLHPVPPLQPGTGRLWTGPTLLGYLWTKLTRGVR